MVCGKQVESSGTSGMRDRRVSSVRDQQESPEGSDMQSYWVSGGRERQQESPGRSGMQDRWVSNRCERQQESPEPLDSAC